VGSEANVSTLFWKVNPLKMLMELPWANHFMLSMIALLFFYLLMPPVLFSLGYLNYYVDDGFFKK
jgi:hypothetical protein